jgi:hypothetical protein
VRCWSWLGLAGDAYSPIERSGLIDLGSEDLARRIKWPELAADGEADQGAQPSARRCSARGSR